MLRLASIAAAVVLAAAVFPAAAAADKDFVLGPGESPSVLVDPDSGVAHVAWADAKAFKVRYCRLPRDATTCATQRELPATLAFGDGDTDAPEFPHILRDPANGNLVIVLAQYVADQVFVYRSADNGDTWTGPTKIYSAGMHGATPSMIVDAKTGEVVIAKFNAYDRVAAVKLDGSEAESAAFADLDTGGHEIRYKAQIAQAPTGELVLIGGSLEGDYDAFAWHAAAGSDPSSAASWSTPTGLGPGGDAALAGGPSGVFGVFATSSVAQTLAVRKWTAGTTFAPGVGIGTGTTPAITVGPSGAVGVASRRGNESWFSLSRNGGATFSPAARIATRVSTDQAVALAKDGKGVTVYGATDGPNVVRAATTDPIPEPAPPPKQVVTPEGTYTLKGIPKCVRPGTRFTVVLSFRRAKRKGNVVVKVRKANFSYQGKTRYSTARPPFRVTFKVLHAKAGRTYVLRARAFLKVRHGKPRSRSIVSKTKVC